MFLYGNYVPNWSIVVAVLCIILLIVAVVFAILWLKAKKEADQVSNVTPITTPIAPSMYSNKSALTNFVQKLGGTTGYRILCVGDTSFAHTATGSQSVPCTSVPYLLSTLFTHNYSAFGGNMSNENVFGYDAMLLDTRCTFTGNWGGCATSLSGAGGRYAQTSTATDKMTFTPRDFGAVYFTFYALHTSAAFSISMNGSTATTVTPSTISPVTGTNIVKYEYTAQLNATPTFTITATKATSSTPVQIFGIASESDMGQNIVNVSMPYNTSTQLFGNGSTPTALTGSGLIALRPDLVVLCPPVSDYNGSNPSSSTTVQNVLNMLAACRSQSIPVLAVTPPWVNNVDPGLQSQFASALANVYSEYQDIVMIYDFQTDMVNLTTEKGLYLVARNYADQQALSILGGMRMAQGIYNAFTQ